MGYEFLGKTISGRFAAVSGILATNANMIEFIARNIPQIGVITTKSIGVEPNPGNREPVICEIQPGCFGNAVGLKNPGMAAFRKSLEDMLNRNPGILNNKSLGVSVYGKTIDDMVILTRYFADIADFIEANISCPHARPGFGASIGSHPSITYDFIKAMASVTDKPIIAKLTPNVTDIGEIAKAAITAGARGLSAINTALPESYLEPYTLKPILYNPDGHKGGKSGTWIKHIGMQAVRKIREAVGTGYPVIGMGGVRTPEDVAQYIEAGVDIVGIGSVIAGMNDSSLVSYFDALEKGKCVDMFLANTRIMEYRPYTIQKIRYASKDLRVFHFDKEMKASPSQFVFAWIPEIGEKPFAVADTSPLKLVIRKITPEAVKEVYNPDIDKTVGKFTREGAWKLKKGDTVMVRGPYGSSPEISSGNIYIVAGGSGIAVANILAKEAFSQGKNVVIYYGVRQKHEAVLVHSLKQNSSKLIIVPDNGKPGKVLDSLESSLSLASTNNQFNTPANSQLGSSAIYNIGNIPFLKKAIAIESKYFRHNSIFASVERNTMCGVGLCGECELDGYRTCMHGTFFSYDTLKNFLSISR